MNPDIDIFIYVIALVLVLVIVFQYIEIRSMRARMTVIESMLRDLQRMALSWMPEEVLSPLRFGVFDTETTGLPFHREARLNQQPRVIEFGGIITDGTEVLSTTEFICNPGIQIEPIITDITGLTNEVLETHEPFSTFIDTLKNYFADCDVIITHNLSFDKSMIVYDLQRQPMDVAVSHHTQCGNVARWSRRSTSTGSTSRSDRHVQPHGQLLMFKAQSSGRRLMLHEVCKGDRKRIDYQRTVTFEEERHVTNRQWGGESARRPARLWYDLAAVHVQAVDRRVHGV